MFRSKPGKSYWIVTFDGETWYREYIVGKLEYAEEWFAKYIQGKDVIYAELQLQANRYAWPKVLKIYGVDPRKEVK